MDPEEALEYDGEGQCEGERVGNSAGAEVPHRCPREKGDQWDILHQQLRSHVVLFDLFLRALKVRSWTLRFMSAVRVMFDAAV